MSFPCTACGLCCQQLTGVSVLSHLDRGDGTCVHYSAVLGCEVYENRPVACRIDEGFRVFAKDRMTLEDFYRLNAEVCNQLQESAGLPPIFRVVL
jgi:Fe-S-cluster containining protein